MDNPLRWRQRFENFERSFLLLDEVIHRDLASFSQLEKEGIVQRFEVLIELSWKTLKDYLENEGYDKVKTGKYAIRQAFQDEIITEAESWMKALEIRNITSHTYNEVVLQKTLLFIKTEFYPIVRDLYHRLKKL